MMDKVGPCTESAKHLYDMNQKELTKTVMMITKWKKWYFRLKKNIFQLFKD